MFILFKIAWRNIWRNKRRSLVIITAIALGLVGGNFISAAYIGLMNQHFEETIEKHISHIQIHHPEFLIDREVRNRIEDAGTVAARLFENPEIKSVASRTVIDGMAASPRFSAGVRIAGVDPVAELETTKFDEQIERGAYFKETGRLPSIVIGAELAGRMGSDDGSRMVLTFQDLEGEMVSASFRVEGIFRSAATAYEEGAVFVEAEKLNELAGAEDAVTEIAILLHEDERFSEVADALKNEFPHLAVRSWMEIAPDLQFIVEYTEMSLIWIMAVILLGVSFGILNTILMSVLERTRELGMLMSVGMKKVRIFWMIVLETLFLSMTGGAAGLLCSFALVGYLHRRGMDLSAIGGEGLREFGFSPVIYPEIHASFYIQVTVMIVFFAILASIYPSRKASRLQPAEAVRKE